MMLSNKFIRTLALLLAFILVAPMVSAKDGECAVEGECADPNAVVIDPNCPDRDHVVRCAGKYLDKNQNGFLERSELQGVIDELPWYARGVLKILGSVDKMMKKCDVDGDDAIGIDYDMSHNSETCLATCFKLRAFKSAFFPDCEL